MVVKMTTNSLIRCICLEKRSQALRARWVLRRRNLARDIQADGAPMVHQAPGGFRCWGPIIGGTIGHQSHAWENPEVRRMGLIIFIRSFDVHLFKPQVLSTRKTLL